MLSKWPSGRRLALTTVLCLSLALSIAALTQGLAVTWPMRQLELAGLIVLGVCVTGLAFGFAGVVLLLGPWRGLGGGEAIGHLACAGAAVCYGIGFPYARRYVATRPESGVVLAAAQLLCATAVLAVFTPFTSAPTLHIGADGLLAILVLGILGTGVAYVLNYAILRAAGATTAATVTYLVPVFSTVLGAVVLSETVHWNQPVGAAVLLTGIAISQSRRRALRPRLRASPARSG